ncbi:MULTISPECIES: YitT family protein [Fusobacterium]|uniref:YitT family protein n=1 Tax=Fusobacterium TaxID=848 RepID=UPI0025BD203A|nr:YitT family protein [Fusobacterium sp.]MDD7392715.1 YitT family protein [Fusobacteriaceae bacterium]MDY5305725.1 YitT family protein [Fusobacterium gastrosuis]MCI5724925.1 YitT family protein [Fusobacterium sp.]MCI7223724.1 YitT family protein [Fusobacterium sp.]MDD7409727.1 YitT family protein [Fusobacteriaceae bacterium]
MKIEKNQVLEIFKTYIISTIGCAILAFSITYFFLGNKLAQGGVSGISLILHYLFHIEVSYLYFALNIPLLIAGYKFLGRDFIFKTLYATLALSIFLKFFDNFRGPMDDILVASIFGGALNGIGLGIIFSSGGSSGGMDIVAKIVNKYKGISISRTLLFLDFVVLSSVAVIFGKNIFMYTLISVVVSAKMIDIIQEGLTSAKRVTIITNFPSEIKQRIMDEVGRGVTVICGRGGYTEKEIDILLCIVGKYQLIKVKNIVKETDPNAFMTVSHEHEVFGKGFQNNSN